MDVKKSKNADLEKKRGLFFQMGIIISLGACLVAFEWNSKNDNLEQLAVNSEAIEEIELPPITMPEKPKPKIPVPKQIAIDELIIKDDEVEIDEELEFTSESSEDAVMDLGNIDMEEEDNDNPVPFYSLEEKPEFPGGESALMSYLAKSVRYPVIAQENNIQGTVYLSFIISKTGKVKNVSLLRGVDSALNKEAVRVVSNMPNWTPGRQGTKCVDVTYQVPIRFVLQ